MNKAEIQAEINKLSFSTPKATETAVTVPFNVPDALFMDLITEFAKDVGWTPDIEVDDPEQGLILEPNPEGALQYVCELLRSELKERFAVFYEELAKRQAEAQVKAQLGAIFNE